MKVFISSVIAGFEDFRDAAAQAIRTLGHEVIRAEHFGASPETPQRTCLAEVREAEVVILILGPGTARFRNRVCRRHTRSTWKRADSAR
jgi:hypothetical protein